jgi:hypothetical protein
VDHINAFGKEHFGGILNVVWTEQKGRIVHATREWEQGEIILVESPTHIVQEDVESKAFRKLQQMCKRDKFDYEPLWYWCALKSLTKEQLVGAYEGGWEPATELCQKNLLLLHHEVTEAGPESEKMAKELVPNCDPIVLERLTQVWVLNCFEYSDNPTGYSVYFFSSFMSHSCYPNAVWHYTGSDHVLRARRPISIGDEVCIAYLPEDGLLQPTMMRRYELHQTKHFWCDCERCSAAEDNTRGMLCPQCKDGTVFSTATDPSSNRKGYQASAWHSRQCNKCGHTLTAKQSEGLAELENRLSQQIERGLDEATPVHEVQQKEKWMESLFSQHFLVDSLWEQLAEYYVKNNLNIEQRRILHKRCEHQKNVYPGLSGSHAWSLEAYADALRTAPRQSAPTKKKGGVWMPVVKAEPELAKQKYLDSIKVLRLMFGEDHEYVTSVDDKLKELISNRAEVDDS